MTPFRNPLARFRTTERLPRRGRRELRFEALEGRALLSGIATITEFPAASVNAATGGIVAGPDGNLWFTESATNAIGMINPTTHAVSSFATPTASSDPWGITVGADGNLWFTEQGANKVGMINPATHVMSEFDTPTTNSGPRAITAGPDGNLWFTEIHSYKIGVINPTTHAMSEFALTNSAVVMGDGITAGSDGNIWFCDQGWQEVGMISPTTHAISFFGVGKSAWGIASGPDGNLWFTGNGFNGTPRGIGTINPTTHAVSSYTTVPIPRGITTGSDNNLWFLEPNNGQIGRIAPTTGTITEYPIPSVSTTGDSLTTGPDGNLWFIDSNNNAIGEATLTTSQLVVTQRPSTVTAGNLFGLTVAAEDSSGNLLTSYNGPLTVSLGNNPGGGTLGGTLTATATDGVATFSGLSLTTAATGYTLGVSGGGFGIGTTSAFAVTPAAATQIVVTSQPPSSVATNTAFTVVATIEDQYGNVVTSANNSVTVSLGSNPGGSTLGGTTTATAVDGVVTFSALKLNKKGKGYTLRLASAGLTGATTSAFNVS